MLTKVTVFSIWSNFDPLVLNVINRPDTDLFEVRDIDGLGAVKADINTTPLGSLDAEVYSGSNIGKRNIVFTLGLTPDWQDWTVSRLRRLLDRYFMPKQRVGLRFESMEFSPVDISGYIESNEPNMFSKDPEQQISIICPNPDFVAINQTIIEGYTDQDPINIEYNANVETGFNITVNKMESTPDPSWVNVQAGDPAAVEFRVDVGPTDSEYLEINSISGNKYVDTIDLLGNRTSHLNDLTAASKWPVIHPGITPFQVVSDAGVQFWYMTYYERFRSL